MCDYLNAIVLFEITCFVMKEMFYKFHATFDPAAVYEPFKRKQNITEHFSPPSSYFHGIISENMVLLCSSAPV